jgi:hypothetical protein
VALELVTVASPATGSSWSTTVPAGKRWRIFGGSCLLVTSGTAAQRDPYMVLEQGTTVFWAVGRDGPWQDPAPDSGIDASSSVRLVFHTGDADLEEDPYFGDYFPVAVSPIPLPEGTTVRLGVHNLQAGDAITAVRLLVDEDDADFPLDSGGTLEHMTFSDPSVGTNKTITVTTGEAWRVWGGSHTVVAGAGGGGGADYRTPSLRIKDGNTHIFVSSNGNDYTDGVTQTVTYVNESATFNKGLPIVTVAGQTWDIDPNPAGLVYNPVGIRPIWLPAGTTIDFYNHNIQVDDQQTDCGLLVERVVSPSATMDELGATQTFSSPAAGSGFTLTVPALKKWRVHGGSARITCSATVASRRPMVRFEDSGNKELTFGSTASGSQANNVHHATYVQATWNVSDTWVNLYVPVPLQQTWLPAGCKVVGTWDGIQAGDQVDQVGFLIEERDA